ncbi:methylcrotonoyl-CoA carboxylase, partial [Candidatus Acetothermia bacterium]|nr:methylcrotonoyl-CoA carboxylase [Candidatus Acetothermia bacterium]
MEVLHSRIQTNSEDFKKNKAHYEKLITDLKEKLAQVQKGGPPQALELHRSRKKLLPRERIEHLLDPDTPFLELNPLAAFGMYG